MQKIVEVEGWVALFYRKTLQVSFWKLEHKLQAAESVYPKCDFVFFDKLKNEIQNSILRFCFYFNKEDEIQITDYHFHV